MDTATLITYLITCTIAAATPGPGTLSVITYSAYLGWRRTLPVILGIQLGMLAMAVLALSGLTAALSASPVLFRTLQYIGALYIAYLGYLSLKHAHSEMRIDSNQHSKQGLHALRHGALVTFASPKTLLFFTSFFPMFIDPSRAVAPQMILLLVLLLGCTLLTHLFYAFAMKLVSNWLRKNSVAFNITVGVIFIGLACYMAWQV
jgi:homoserine/homoserine lactone efflux protein